jgi:hypothetical protein
LAAEIPRKVESGITKRADAARNGIKREVAIGRTFVGDLTSLRPIKAVIDVVVDTIDNVGDFVKEQASITREWIG